jgi:hypothetical protein
MSAVPPGSGRKADIVGSPSVPSIADLPDSWPTPLWRAARIGALLSRARHVPDFFKLGTRIADHLGYRAEAM